jgi:hypothetical protein
VANVTTAVASGLLPSKITLGLNEGVATVAVTISGLNTTLGLTPSGTVHFSDNKNDDLGTVKLPSCTLRTCDIADEIRSTSLSSGVTELTATYSGDTLLESSAASYPMTGINCPAGQTCTEAGFVSHPGVSVTVDGGSSGATGIMSVGGNTLDCGLGVGNVAAVDIEPLRGAYGPPETITIRIPAGADADRYRQASQATADPAAGHSGYLCGSTVGTDPVSFGPTVPLGSPYVYTQTLSDFTSLGHIGGLLADCGFSNGSVTVDPQTTTCLASVGPDSAGDWVFTVKSPEYHGYLYFGG